MAVSDLYNSVKGSDGSDLIDSIKSRVSSGAKGTVAKSFSASNGTFSLTKFTDEVSSFSLNAQPPTVTTAGSVGPTGNVTINLSINTANTTLTGSGSTFTVPYIYVDAKGRVTSKANRTITVNILRG